LSRKSIRFFYFISNYNEESWETRQLNVSKLQWKTNEAKIGDTDSIRKTVNKIISFYKNKIELDLKEKFMPQKTEESQAKDDKSGTK
jgi:hypothetical protein